MKTIGITGGVGAGKSEVLRFLKEAHGAEVLFADEVAKELYEPGSECLSQIAAAFPEAALLSEDGSLVREALAEMIYADEENRRALNAIVHPLVRQAIRERKRALQETGEVSLLVIEAALFFEGGLDAFCDEVWYIDASESVRRERLAKTRGYSPKRISAMMKAQPSEQDFRSRCDLVIDNSGAFESTRKQLAEQIGRLCGL